MAYDPSVVVQAETVAALTERPYLHVWMVSFAPSTTAFLNGFEANAPYKDPTDGNKGIAAILTKNNWESRLKAWGAEEGEPLWQWLSAHFNPLGAPDAQGFRSPPVVTIPPRVVVGKRKRSVVAEQTIEYTAVGAAGTFVTITINPSKNVFDDGWLAQVIIEQDGLKTLANLRNETVAALNAIAAFSALYLAAPVGIAGEFTITSLADGFPLIVKIEVTTGGPTVTSVTTTANIAGDYQDDLDDIRAVVELTDDPTAGKPLRWWYWMTDVQGDDTVNDEGMDWAQDRREDSPPIDYQFHGQSHPAFAVGNFNPLAVASPAQEAQDAVGGVGYGYGSVNDHDLYEWMVAAEGGRTTGYKPGEINFSDRQLYGATRYARITPRDKADNASLAAERTFNYYSPEGPRGSFRWGYLANGSFWDRPWVADYARWQAVEDLTAWKIRRNIVQYTDDDISAGASVIKQSLLKIPGIARFPDLITVTYKKRVEVNPNNIVERVYVDYTVTCGYAGPINRFGTLAEPITITISETIS